MKNNKHKHEFSKLIFWLVFFTNTAVIIFSAIIIAITKDTTALCYLIPSVGAEMASATGFYYTKAKVENRIKLMHTTGVKPENNDFKE